MAPLNICLNMIVRDEEKVIERCIRSCLPLITSYCIVDTGSVDNTIDILQRFLPTTGLPGKLYTSPWKDFATNRNEALQLAKYPKIDPKTGQACFPAPDFILFIDADETLIFDSNFSKDNISKEVTSYFFGCHFGHVIYRRKLLIRADLDWYWFGVVHEAITCAQDEHRETLPGVINRPTSEGARSRNPNKYKLDANTIERDYIENPTPRNCFYIAMCYKDDMDSENALKWFKKRAEMKGSEEEMFISYMYIGKFTHIDKGPEGGFWKALPYFLKAHELWPARWEPLFELSQGFRLNGYSKTAYMYNCQAEQPQEPKDLLYIDKSVYAWKLLDEYAVTHFELTRDVVKTLELFKRALAHPHTEETIDDESKQRIQQNIQKLEQAIAEKK